MPKGVKDNCKPLVGVRIKNGQLQCAVKANAAKGGEVKDGETQVFALNLSKIPETYRTDVVMALTSKMRSLVKPATKSNGNLFND